MDSDTEIALVEEQAAANVMPADGSTLLNTWVCISHLHLFGKEPLARQVNGRLCFLWRDRRGIAQATDYHPGISDRTRFTGDPITAGSGHYVTRQAFGYLWLWYGYPQDADEGLLPDIPYIPRKGGLPRHMHATQLFRCSSGLAIENLLDLTHADFLHSYVTGDEDAESDEVRVEFTSETVTMIREQKNKLTPKFMRVMGVKAPRTSFRGIVHVIVRSGVAHAVGRFTPGYFSPVFAGHVAENTMQTRLNTTLHPLECPRLFKLVMPLLATTVGGQDDYMFGPQNPRYLQYRDQRDLHSPFDAAGNRFREVYRKLATRQRAGDLSYGPDAKVGGSLAELFQMKPL